MQYTISGERGARRFLVKIEPGEKVMATLRACAERWSIAGALLSGVGAVRDTELGWFDAQAKQYRTQTFPELMELLALSGNIARSDGEVIVHAHVVCAGRDLQARGGHLMEAICAVTVEAAITETPFALERTLDPRFDLKLLDLRADSP